MTEEAAMHQEEAQQAQNPLDEFALDEEDQVLEPSEQWVSFRLGQETYALKALNVQEILKAEEISPVPGAPHFVLGVINLRGNIVTVMDTRQRFGLAEPPAEGIRQVIVTETAGQTLGLLVDDVSEVVGIRSEEIEPAPELENAEIGRHILGVVRSEEGLRILIDVDRLLPESEQRAGAES